MSHGHFFSKIQTSIVVVMGDMISSFVAHMIEKRKLLLNFFLPGFGSEGVSTTWLLLLLVLNLSGVYDCLFMSGFSM